jgi:hypothetical protein
MQLITKHFPDAVPGMEQADRRKLLFSVSGPRIVVATWRLICSLPQSVHRKSPLTGRASCAAALGSAKCDVTLACVERVPCASAQLFRVMREWQGLKTAEMAAKDLRAKRAQRAAAQAERRERAAQREAQQAQQVQTMRRSGCLHCSAACAVCKRLESCRSNGRNGPRFVTQSGHILSLMFTGPTRITL